MPGDRKEKILLLTIVHPDFLPPVYAAAQTLRDNGYAAHVLTFDSFVPSDVQLGADVTVETLGKHHNVPFRQRWKLRRNFVRRTRELVNEGPVAVIAFCQYSFLYALKTKKVAPVIYHGLEMADFQMKNFFRSPLNSINNLRALRSVHKADLVATPSVQRSAWLAGRCHLEQSPTTVLNTAYLQPSQAANNEADVIPTAFAGKKLVLYTGAVNDRLCVKELVEAFTLINDPNAAMLVTGMKDNDYCKQITAIAEQSAARDRILLRPYVSRVEMLALQEKAHIGMCLSREYQNDLESQMIAPNKVGEYLVKGLYLVGVQSVYMQPLAMSGVATLAATPTSVDIAAALANALKIVEDDSYRNRIANFVKEYFCMQVQLKPVIEFIKNKRA